MLGDCQYSSHQEEDVGSVNTICIQVVIIVVHTVSSVSTHMCYTVYCCDMCHTLTKQLKSRGEGWWQRRREGVLVAARRERAMARWY